MSANRALMRNIAVAAIVLALTAACIWQVARLMAEARRLSDMRLSLDSTMEGAQQLQVKLRLLDEEIAKLGLVKVNLYFSGMTDTGIYITPVKRVVDKDSIAVSALRRLMEGPGENDDGLYAIAPEGVEVLGAKIQGGVAYADFSGKIMYPGFGSEGELAMVSAIVDTLCELPGVEKVQILVEGEVVESLGGHVLVDSPLGRMEELVRR